MRTCPLPLGPLVTVSRLTNQVRLCDRTSHRHSKECSVSRARSVTQHKLKSFASRTNNKQRTVEINVILSHHKLSGKWRTQLKGRAFGNLGDCYDALGDFEEAVKCHEQHLAISLKLKSSRDQERAYRGLGHSHKCLGNLQQALVCFEKRLVVSHELNSPNSKASAYGELGHIHSTLGNFEQAISCLEHQLTIARELKDKVAEADAACGLGAVYQQMGEYSTALQYHQADLDTAEELGLAALQGRACGNLGTVHESLGNFEEAVRYQEQHLSVAAQTNDKLAKTMAYSSLGWKDIWKGMRRINGSNLLDSGSNGPFSMLEGRAVQMGF
ncbi:unnamed protein product [Timema podura]|uniref:Tetratricopeptide repeat protein 28 n=1 Tax=Timema podura TaxID=61482 RepID=A0ABN7NBV9_TIMPD|nr:unnamed protein product [Timema podura]